MCESWKTLSLLSKVTSSLKYYWSQQINTILYFFFVAFPLQHNKVNSNISIYIFWNFSVPIMITDCSLVESPMRTIRIYLIPTIEGLLPRTITVIFFIFFHVMSYACITKTIIKIVYVLRCLQPNFNLFQMLYQKNMCIGNNLVGFLRKWHNDPKFR